MTQPSPLSALLRKEDDLWVLQCLDYDIAVQGGALPELFTDFERVMNAHIMLDVKAGRSPLANVPPAPDHYWEQFRGALKTEGFLVRLVQPVTARPRATKKLIRSKSKKPVALPSHVPPAWVIRSRSIVSDMRVA